MRNLLIDESGVSSGGKETARLRRVEEFVDGRIRGGCRAHVTIVVSLENDDLAEEEDKK